jgi:chromosome partitioning protein
MAIVISFINLKGGVGKTTLVTAIGEFLSFFFKHKVLLIDMDHQTNLTYAMLSPEKVPDEKNTMYGIFQMALKGENPNAEDFIIKDCSNIDRIGHPDCVLHIIPSHPALIELDNQILEYAEKGEKILIDVRQVLKNVLIPVLNNYDYILIDCPPHLGITTQNAMLISDYFVVPVVPEFLSLQGLELIQKRISELKEKYKEEVKIEFLGCIINKLDLKRRQDSVALASLLYYSEKELEDLRNKDEDTLTSEEKHIKKYIEERYRGGVVIDYKPFKWWLLDAKPLYIITDYMYPERRYGEKKFLDFRLKYYWETWRSFSNPVKWPKLWRYEVRRAGRDFVEDYKSAGSYNLFNRIGILCKEIITKTKYKYEKK